MFSAHGKAHLQYGDDSIVVLFVEGPWNMELVSSVHATMSQNPMLNSGMPWGFMIVVSKSTLFGQQALHRIQEAVRKEAQNSGRVATAWVIGPDVEGANLMASVIKGIYAGIQPVEIFRSMGAARDWLNDQVAIELRARGGRPLPAEKPETLD